MQAAKCLKCLGCGVRLYISFGNLGLRTNAVPVCLESVLISLQKKLHFVFLCDKAADKGSVNLDLDKVPVLLRLFVHGSVLVNQQEDVDSGHFDVLTALLQPYWFYANVNVWLESSPVVSFSRHPCKSFTLKIKLCASTHNLCLDC